MRAWIGRRNAALTLTSATSPDPMVATVFTVAV
jgi:hypothetical protein